MNEKKNHPYSMIFFAVLILLTGYFIFRDNSFQEILHDVLNVNIFFLLCGMCMMFLYTGCESGVMFILLKNLGQKTKYVRCLGYSYVDFYFSSITPSSTGGQPMQMYYMNKDGITMSNSSLVILIYIILYQSTFLLFCLMMFILKHTFLQSVHIERLSVLLVYGTLASGLMITAVLIALFSKKTAKSIAGFLIKVLAKIRIIKDKEKVLENLDHQIDNYIQSAIFLKSNTKMLLQLYAILILQFTAYFSIPYFVYLAFGQHGYHWSDFVAMQSMVQLSAGSLPLPGAVGASERSFVKLFQYVYPSDLLMPGLLLSRGINFYLYLIVSGVSVFFVHLRVDRLPKKKNHNPVN